MESIRELENEVPDPDRGTRLLQALNTAAATLQRSAQSEAAVYQAFREQMVRLGLSGGLSLLEESGRQMVVYATAHPNRIGRALTRLEKAIGMTMEGFTFNAAEVDVYRQVIETKQSLYLEDSRNVIAQMLPQGARKFSKQILAVVGARPAIHAPIIIDGRVLGVVNAAGTDLTPDDLPAFTAFANHIAAAIQNAQMFASMRESEEKFRVLAEKSPNMIFINQEGRIVYANEACEEIMGYTREELQAPAFNFFCLVTPESVETVRENYRRHQLGKEAPPYECQLLTKEGQRLEAILTTRLITYEGKPATLGILTDVTERNRAEKQLRRLSQAVESSPSAVLIYDLDGLIEYANPKFVQISGYRVEEVVGRHANFQGGDNPKINEILWETISAGHEWQGEFHNQDKGGNSYWVLSSISPIKNASGQITHYVEVQEDITARKRAEEHIRQRNRELTLLNRVIATTVSTLEPEVILEATCRELALAFNLFQASATLLDERGKTLRVVAEYRPEDGPTGLGVEIPIESIPAAQYFLEQKLPLAIADAQHDPRIAPVHELMRQYNIASVLLLPLVVGDSVTGIIGLYAAEPREFAAEEITLAANAAATATQALQKAQLFAEVQRQAKHLATLREVDLAISSSLEPEERFQTIVEHAAHLLECDVVNLLKWDPEAREAVGLASHGTPGGNSIKGERIPESASALLPKLLSSPQAIAIPDATQDERVLPVWCHRFGIRAMMALPLLYREQTIGYLMFLDTRSARHWSTDEISMAEALASQVAIAVANAHLFAVERQRKAHLEAINTIIARASAASELSDLLEVVLDNILEAVGLEVGAVWSITRQYAIRGLTREGVADWMAAEQAAHWKLTEPIFVEDWQLEMPEGAGDAMQLLAARLEIRATLTVPILAKGRYTGGISLIDKKPRRWSEEEISLVEAVGQALGGTAERLHLLETTQRQAQQMQQIMDTMSDAVLLLDAKRKVVLANPIAHDYLALLTDHEMDRPLTRLGDQPVKALMGPPPPGALCHELRVGDTSQRIFEVMSHALEAGPQIGRSLLLLREVTEERQQDQYRQAQERLASIGQLSAGIAHDFNNIMGVIVLYSQMLIKNAQLSAKHQAYATTMYQQAKYAAKLIEQILDFSRRSVMERQSMNLVPLVKEMLQLWKRTLPENIDLNLTYDEREYFVNVDPTRLQQVLMNLAVNAHHAMPNGGALRITLSSLTLKQDQMPPLPDMSAGDWLNLTVSDTGSGIRPQDLPHIFEPFFTTKAPGKGTGLGLAQVYGIIKQHDGYIDVTSQVGQGTTFTIYLPSLTLYGDESAETEAEIAVIGGCETILVVEDAGEMREAVCNTLEALNYRTLVASNGKEALNLFERRPDEIDLVLSDIVMPEMDGFVLSERLKAVKPDIKTVLMSGYPLEIEDTELLRQGVAAWVEKPFNDAQIVRVIQKALVS